MSNGISTQIDPGRMLIWKYGRPAELWLSYHHQIAEFIKRHKLKPLTMEEYPFLPLATELGATTFTKDASQKMSTKLRWPVPFPGGMRTPHLHYGRDVFLMEPVQWKEFSQKVVTDIHDRLAGANEISFDQALELGQAAASLTR